MRLVASGSNHVGILIKETGEFKQTMYEKCRTGRLLYHSFGLVTFYLLSEALYTLEYVSVNTVNHSYNSFNSKHNF